MVQVEGSSLCGDIYQNFCAMIFISVLLGLIDFSDIVMLGSGPNSCCQQNLKDVHRRQKLTTDFFQTFRVDYFGCEYLNFEKKICLPWFPGGHFLRGLITKS